MLSKIGISGIQDSSYTMTSPSTSSFSAILEKKINTSFSQSCSEVESMSTSLYNNGKIDLEQKMMLWSYSHRPKSESDIYSTEMVEVKQVNILDEIDRNIKFASKSGESTAKLHSLKESVRSYIENMA